MNIFMHLNCQTDGTHSLLVQFEKLLGDFGRAERQSQARDVELWHHLLQDLLEWQTPNGAVPPRGGHRVLQDGASQCHQLHVKVRKTKTSSNTGLFIHTCC